MHDVPTKYRLVGTRVRRINGQEETFDTIVVATGYDDAQTAARWNWNDYWRDIHFTRVTQVSR